jgi:DNA modification methylase
VPLVGQVYRTERATLIQGDCLEVMDSLPDRSVDAVVTDPPYCSGAIGESQRVSAKGQGLRSGTIRKLGWFVGDNMGTAGLAWLLRQLAIKCRRIIRPSGSVSIFCDWRMLPNITPAVESAGLRYQDLLVWDKGRMGLGNGFRRQHELILHFTLGSPIYHHKGTSNVLQASRVRAADRQHQTEKPVGLLVDIIGVVSPTTGVVLDPLAGSGTTGVACLQTGRKFIGIEISGEYCRIAKERIAKAELACVKQKET